MVVLVVKNGGNVAKQPRFFVAVVVDSWLLIFGFWRFICVANIQILHHRKGTRLLSTTKSEPISIPTILTTPKCVRLVVTITVAKNRQCRLCSGVFLTSFDLFVQRCAF